jgi:Ca2+-binding EF-hand superfamily protein
MRKIVTLSLAAAALVGAGGVAYAQADQAPAVARAPLTRTDVEQRSAEAFARMDANRDGVLDRADRDAHRQERFARLDANDDGELDPADREARRKAAFDRLDADRSGGISFEEFSALREQRQEPRAERRGPRLGMRGRGGPGMARAADTNRDGTITQAEFASAALARFDRIDVDKDGTISDNERPARRMMRRERRLRDAG